MKQLVKAAVGHGALSLARKFPGTRSRLARLGMRTTQGLFHDTVVSVEIPGCPSFKLRHVDESYLAFQLFWLGANYYEPITRAVILALLKPGMTFLDIGANIGFFSLATAVGAGPTRIIAFEPNPKNFKILQANALANGLTNLTCEPLAISDYDGTATLYLTESDMSASLMKGFQAEDTQQIGEVAVRTISLDSYAAQKGLSGPLLIKVDIEGHEPAFFRGAAEMIATRTPDIILEVLYDQDPDLVSRLKSLGYHFYPITDQGLVELDAPRLTKRCPFLFLNHLLSVRPRQELQSIFDRVKVETRDVDLRQTSEHFPPEHWPLLWKTEN